MKERNNSIFYIIIMVLVAIICLLIGLIFGGNLLSNDDKNEENNVSENDNKNEKEEQKIINLSTSEGKNFFEKVTIYNDYFLKDYSVTGLKNASNNTILYFLVSELDGFDGGTSLGKIGFTTTDLQKVADKYISNDIKINYTNILVPQHEEAILYKLNQNGKYEYNDELGIGGPGAYVMEEYYIDGYYNKTKDEYTINTKLLYNQWCPDICSRHDSYYSDSALNNVVYTNNSNSYMELTDVYDLVKDKLPITSYTFVKNSSGNYVLNSVTVK